jgi:hypothetical protein
VRGNRPLNVHREAKGSSLVKVIVAVPSAALTFVWSDEESRLV